MNSSASELQASANMVVNRTADDSQCVTSLVQNEPSSLLGQHLMGGAPGINNEDIGKGFDIVRLTYPTIDEINEDFICGIC